MRTGGTRGRHGFVLALLAAQVAGAASISGTVTNTSSAGLALMEVRAWRDDGKGYAIVATATTDGAGAYTLAGLGVGTYRVDARMSPSASGDYGDRWYDVAAPTGNGYVEDDADALALSASDALSGIDLQLEANGGFDGTVSAGAGLYGGPEVRAELLTEVRTHHNDFTKASPHLGEYSFRGLVPGGYRVLAWDLNGLYETYVSGGPWNVTANAVGAGPAIGLQPMAADPYEPNDGPSASGAAIDSSLFRQSPPQPFSTSGALIGPRGSDVDCYCFDVKAHDRFFITAQGELTLEDGSKRVHPYVDPVVALYDATGGGFTFVKQDDDSGPVLHAAKLDTGPLPADGRYCAVVSTYGDTSYTGAGQGSAGRYQATLTMGNRSPAITGIYMSVPVRPTITIDEGATVNLDVLFSDPDGDPLTAGFSFVDSGGATVSSGSFNGPSGAGFFSWSASQTAAMASPYTLTLHAADAEFTTNLVVTVVVNQVNSPPSTPELLAPSNDSVVPTFTPQLVCSQAIDLDFDPLTYRFELYYSADAGVADQTAWLTPDAGSGDGGAVLWNVTAIPENTHARWRVRAFDGNATNGYSPWSAFGNFVVSTVNDPPPAPVILKPTEGEVVVPIRPTIEVSNPADPEGQSVDLAIDVASDAAFSSMVAQSGALPAAGAPQTMWTVTKDLVWGNTYFVRARATDSGGAQSPYSATVSFQIKPDAPPSAVAPDEPFVAKCDDLRLDAAPPLISVTPATDPDGDKVSIELSIFDASADPDTAAPLFHQVQDQPSVGSTSFDTSQVAFTRGLKYRVRVRSTDGFATTPWTDCYFTISASVTSKTKGCGCDGVGGPAATLLLGLLAARRRRR